MQVSLFELNHGKNMFFKIYNFFMFEYVLLQSWMLILKVKYVWTNHSDRCCNSMGFKSDYNLKLLTKANLTVTNLKTCWTDSTQQEVELKQNQVFRNANFAFDPWKQQTAPQSLVSIKKCHYLIIFQASFTNPGC